MTLREFILDDSFKYSNKIKPKKKQDILKTMKIIKNFLIISKIKIIKILNLKLLFLWK